MTTGPIEFLSDSGPAREVPSTEFGGADGLIQPANDTRLNGDPEASGGHTLESGRREESSEVAGIIARDAMRPLSPTEGWTGVASTEDVVDPVTGRVAPSTVNKAGGTGVGELSDLQPG